MKVLILEMVCFRGLLECRNRSGGAVSVHKSQGSEYPCVVIPLLTQHYILLQRNLLYTAITRGKRLVIVVGSKKALGIAVKNDKTQKRFTWLKNRLKGR